MKYMLLLFDDESWWNTVTDEEIATEMEAHSAFARYCETQGIGILGGEALQASSTATTLRGTDDVIVTDGPFVELKEQCGGFYVIECRDIDQAVEAARHCPIGSGTEVRPVVDRSG